VVVFLLEFDLHHAALGCQRGLKRSGLETKRHFECNGFVLLLFFHGDDLAAREDRRHGRGHRLGQLFALFIASILRAATLLASVVFLTATLLALIAFLVLRG